jgi:hypothetical protein
MAKDPTPRVDEKALGNPEPGMAHWPLDLELHPDAKDERDSKPKPAPKQPGKRPH